MDTQTPRDTGAGAAPAVRLRGVTLGYGDHVVVGAERPLDLDLPAGRTTAIIGANGCGKSTLLRGLTRQLPLRSGTLEVLGRSTEHWPARGYARSVALLPQSPVAPDGMTVEQLVDRGRHPHRGWFGARTAADVAAVARALELTDLVELAGADLSELSGGQRQRAWLALVLAQQTPVVLLDEPTSYLDLSHQVELMDLVRRLPDPTAAGTVGGEAAGPAGPRATVVAVLHELNLAARCADHVVAMARGQVVAAGAPGTVLTPALLAEVYGLDADVVPDPLLGHPVVLPRTRADRRG
ncbi:ABC transporter ATP-binding protein [Citricoccus sp. SGAir0253]|uniref:ABC transporter ATP-binding protein n=1 Tax=Citricoccus sp. SGAir0253 TaxID=2567881 RepID=UPI0010CCB937|nr:ABC transporter ATP-binding protein [Citricoccus sp. SGAir0253]QCU79143.1 ABC transporter ATP-binding protein [Citricoccus sp. SGAir0253]